MIFEALIDRKLSLQEIAAWSEALPPSLKQAHPNRIEEWVRSRMALQTAFAEAGVHLDIKSFRYMELKRLPTAPGWTFSLSHAEEAALAIVGREPTSIGVDIERLDRVVSESVDARVRRSEDLALSPLQLWSAKEAAFKAVPLHLQKGLTVSLISIYDREFAIPSLGVSGHWKQIVAGPYLKSFAWFETD